jgi:hypothetical protein
MGIDLSLIFEAANIQFPHIGGVTLHVEVIFQKVSAKLSP